MSKRGENIYKRKDGRWEGRSKQLDGNYHYFYGKSYKEVKDKKNNHQQTIMPQTKKTKAEDCAPCRLFDRWLKECASLRVKPSTYENYYYCVTKYIIPYFVRIKDAHLTEQHIKQFVKHINENNALSGLYQKKIVSIMKTALRDMMKENEISKLSLESLKIPATDIKQVEAFTVREQCLIENILQDVQDIKKVGILLCLYSGIRLGELCALKWNNIDLEMKTIIIHGTVIRTKNFNEGLNKTQLIEGTPKNRSSVRKIPLPVFLNDRFLRLKKGNIKENNYVLSNSEKPIDPRTYQRFYKKILAQAGVRYRKFHAIRHTFATRALEAGVDIKTLSDMLGHSSVTNTLNIYAHSMMEQKVIAIDKMNNFYESHRNSTVYAVKNSVSSEI